MIDRPAPKPPWVVHPGIDPDEFFWREAGEPWLNLVWRPFWNALDEGDRARYLEQWPPPQAWHERFLDDALDQLVAAIDREDFGDAGPPPMPRRRKRSLVARWFGGLLRR